MPRPLRAVTASLTIDELLAQSAWFIALDAPSQRRVRAEVVERSVLQGAMLGHAGEEQHAWFGMLEGLIKWSINEADGRSLTLGGQSAGSWFGEGTLLRRSPRRSDLVALRHSRVAMVPAVTFEWLRKHSPGFDGFLLEQINERMHWFMGTFAARALRDTDAQVARALLGMVHPLLNPRGERHLRLSQEELANLAAVSRQSCNAAMTRLRDAGLVRSEYGSIVVLDLPGLQQRAD